MSNEQVENQLAENFADPKKGKNDMGEWEQHPLQDQMKYADRCGANTAQSQRNWGLGIKRFNTPGTV